jgi:hypothetical protein
VKTGNPSVCATVDWKVCRIVTALQLSVIKRTCNRSANKSNHPVLNPLFSSRIHMTFWCQKLAVRIILDSPAVVTTVKYVTTGVRSGTDWIVGFE